MSKTTFNTNPKSLQELLNSCASGKIQLPDFQRSWVWAEDRILSLIASISRAFPVGALMTLVTKPGNTETFARRPIEGAQELAKNVLPEELLLDGQQRMTSLYHACMSKGVVVTTTAKNKLVKRWFYIDILKAMQNDADRDEAIFSVPEDKQVKSNFNKVVMLDLSTPELEYSNMMFPLNQVFGYDVWQDDFGDYWIKKGDLAKTQFFRQFKETVLQNFRSYTVPVIALSHDTTHEAVCLVFEKVNTGGKPLDAFELLTAMYAAQGHKLRDDWLGRGAEAGIQKRLQIHGAMPGQSESVLAKVASTDFLQAIALLHSKKVRLEKLAAGVKESELPAIRATRQSLLDLPLSAYLEHRQSVEEGFKQSAKFLMQQNIYRVKDLPYQTQLVPLAAIFAELGKQSEHSANMDKIARWYWCGVFGELYGSTVESRFAKDILEVPNWLSGGPEPTTVKDGQFRADRLYTMRTRLSAAYKGIHAMLMCEGAKDFRTGQSYGITAFFDEAVDIHHIFPEAWCKQKKIEAKEYDTVINKTPLGYKTNRIIGGVAPSKYLEKLVLGKKTAQGQIEDPPIEVSILDGFLESHCIPSAMLHADDFQGFMESRRQLLLALIAKATGHKISVEAMTSDDGEELSDDLARDCDSPIEQE